MVTVFLRSLTCSLRGKTLLEDCPSTWGSYGWSLPTKLLVCWLIPSLVHVSNFVPCVTRQLFDLKQGWEVAVWLLKGVLKKCLFKEVLKRIKVLQTSSFISPQTSETRDCRSCLLVDTKYVFYNTTLIQIDFLTITHCDCLSQFKCTYDECSRPFPSFYVGNLQNQWLRNPISADCMYINWHVRRWIDSPTTGVTLIHIKNKSETLKWGQCSNRSSSSSAWCPQHNPSLRWRR